MIEVAGYTKRYGSTVAVPVARQIVEALLVIEKIPPSLPIPPAGRARPAA